jgi:ribonuclease P protein component
MRFKLSKRARLRNRKAFRSVYEEGRFISNFMIAVHYVPQVSRTGQNHRIGFTAGKRLGNAVKRNRCKRRLKELYRLHQAEFPDGFDFVVVARKAMVSCEWGKLADAFHDVLRRTKLKSSSTKCL